MHGTLRLGDLGRCSQGSGSSEAVGGELRLLGHGARGSWGGRHKNLGLTLLPLCTSGRYLPLVKHNWKPEGKLGQPLREQSKMEKSGEGIWMGVGKLSSTGGCCNCLDKDHLPNFNLSSTINYVLWDFVEAT